MSGGKINFSHGPVTLLITAAAMAMALQACGGTPYEEDQVSQQSTYTPPSDNGSGSGSGSGSSTTTGGDAFSPGYSYSFDNLTGTSGANPSYKTGNIDTDSILKVRITAAPGSNLSIAGYGNWWTTYNCIQYKVSLVTVVGSQEYPNGSGTTTSLLAVPGAYSANCSSGSSYQDIDFSSRLGSADHYKIKVSDARYDFYCQMYWSCYYNSWNPACWGMLSAPSTYYCPTRPVYSNHSVAGQLDIEVNGSAQ